MDVSNITFEELERDPAYGPSPFKVKLRGDGIGIIAPFRKSLRNDESDPDILTWVFRPLTQRDGLRYWSGQELRDIAQRVDDLNHGSLVQ